MATHPGSRRTQVQAGLGIGYPGQVSALLGRLERRGLAYGDQRPVAASAWQLTEPGAAVLERMPEEIYE